MPILSENEKNSFCKRAIAAKNDIEFRFVNLGAMLYKIKEEHLYEAGWTSWEDYAQELKMSPSSISRLIRIYEVFILRYKFAISQLANIGWTNLAELLPDVQEDTKKEKVQEWLGQAAELTNTDLRRTITERRKGVDMAKCLHKNSYTIKICPDCGDRRRI